MTPSLQLPVNLPPLTSPNYHSTKIRTTYASNIPTPSKKISSLCYYSTSNLKIGFLSKERFELRVLKGNLSFLEGERGKDGIWKRNKRVVLVRFNDGFGFNGGGGGGGGRDNNMRALGNLVLAIVLTYFTMTGQLGWLLDAVVSIWLLAIIVPIAGLGAFMWWAGRDIVQSSCPNCGNDFQVFKSMLNDEVQLCPYCTQPFSVVGDEFVRDPVKFSNQTNPYGQAFSDFSPGSKKGKDASVGVVDIEAEIRDAE